MRSTLSVSTLIALVQASEDIGPHSYSKTTTTNLFNQNGTKWDLTTQSVYDENKGIEYFRMTHELTAPIKATDLVSFEIAFTVKNDPWTNKFKIAEDVATCSLTQST